MKIVHISATYPPYYSGTGNVCYHNAHGLARRGHQVQVITAATPLPPDFRDPPGVQVRRLPALLRVGNAPLLRGMMPLPVCDLVHLHYPFILGAELVWLNHWLQHQPYILTYHNDLVWKGIKGIVFTLYQKLWTQRILWRATRVLVPTLDFAHSSRWIQPIIHHRTQHVLELANGVDLSYFHPALSGLGIRQQWGLNPHTHHVLLFAGALDSAHHLNSGLPNLLQAIAILQNPHIRLLVVGDGDAKAMYRNLANTVGISQQTHFVGWVKHSDIGSYYTVADIVIQPSQLSESFGMVGVEALACGTPVIASDLPGVRSVIHHGSDGLLVPPGDPHALAQAISVLLSNPAQRQAMGARGRAKVQQQYAWQVIIPQLEQIYREVLADAAHA